MMNLSKALSANDESPQGRTHTTNQNQSISFTKLLQTTAVLQKARDNLIKDSQDTEEQQNSQQKQIGVLVDFKTLTPQYFVEQIILLNVFHFNLKKNKIKIEKDQAKLAQQYDDEFNELKKLYFAISQPSVIEFLLNQHYSITILEDLIIITLNFIEIYLNRDQFKLGESPLLTLFSFLQLISIRPEAQLLLLNTQQFYDISVKYTRQVQKKEEFWEREIVFLQIISNVISYDEITDFTSISFLQNAEILISFYDYARRDHSKAKQRLEKTKRKDLDVTPPILFETGVQQLLTHLAILPAYLAEFSAQQKLRIGEKFSKIIIRSNSDLQPLQQQYTAICVLRRMCLDSIEKNELSKNLSGILESMEKIIQVAPSVIKRSIISFYRQFLKTNDMRCWLKMSSPFLAIDSTNTLTNMLILGNPRYFGDEFGLYDKWGAYFDEGDAIYMKNRIKFDSLSQIRSYSISLWFLYPFRTFEEFKQASSQNIDQQNIGQSTQQELPESKKKFRTFLQCEAGIGCILGIVNETHIAFFDDEMRMHSFDMQICINFGWNNLILKVDNSTQNVKLLLNRKEIANRFNVTISRNIAFVGNSFDRNEPSGAICDLRFFESIIPDDLVEKIVNYSKLEGMPDLMHDLLEKNGMCLLVKSSLEKNKKEEDVLIDILKLVANLCTNQNIKLKLIAQGIFNNLIVLLSHKNLQIRIASQKAINFLS